MAVVYTSVPNITRFGIYVTDASRFVLLRAIEGLMPFVKIANHVGDGMVTPVKTLVFPISKDIGLGQSFSLTTSALNYYQKFNLCVFIITLRIHISTTRIPFLVVCIDDESNMDFASLVVNSETPVSVPIKLTITGRCGGLVEAFSFPKAVAKLESVITPIQHKVIQDVVKICDDETIPIHFNVTGYNKGVVEKPEETKAERGKGEEKSEMINGKEIFTGKGGGKYYLTKTGRRVYIGKSKG